MAGVWTAAGLQGHDGASNSLSRSLSSLMAADENGHPSTVYLRSNMPPSLRYSVGSTLEREPAYPSETVLPLMRQSSAPTPKFEKLLTNSSSSVQYMGKKIIREYQSAFVLPDKQTVTVTRVEIFFPEQAKAEVTINLAVGSEREVPVSYMRGPPKVARRRIRDYLQHNSWASAMLASSESRDAELLGRMGSKYSDTICRRSRLERSESRKSRQEVVIAQQASSDEEDFDQGSMSEEDLKDKEVEYSTRVEGPTRPRSSVEYRVYREENSFNAYRTRQHSAVSEPEFSRAPVIAHAEPPGKRVIPMSDITSKQNFKELRRQWDERIAEEIRKSSDEWINYSSQRPTKIRDQRSPQSSVVTPAYPARYDRTEQNIQSFSPRTSHTLPPSLPASQFPEADPMRSGKTVIVERDDFGPSALSPTSVISEPSTERGEKETQFIYNQRLLRFNRGEVNRLDATRQGLPYARRPLHPHPPALRTQSLDRCVGPVYVFPPLATSLSVYNAEDDKANSTKADDTSFRSNRTTLSLNVHPQNWSGRGEKNQRIKYNYDYIYQSTLSRLPVRLSNIRPRSHSVQGFESSRYSMRIPESHPIQTTQKNLTLSGCPVVIIDIVSNQETSESNIEIPRNNKTIPQLPGEIQKNQIKIGIVGKTANITSEMGRKNMTACKTVPDYRRSRSADSWESLNSPYKVHALPLHKQRASKIYPRPGSFELKDNLGPDMMESTSVSHPLPPLAIPTQAHKSTKSRQPQRVEQAAQRVQRGESLPVRESDMEKPKLPPQVLPEDYEWLGTLDRRSQPATYFDGLKQFQTVEPLPSVPARLVPVSPGISQKSAEQFERERQKIPAIDHKESFVRRPNRPQSTPAFRTSSGTDESPLPSPPPTPPEYRDYTRPHSSPDRFINKTREEDMRTPKNLRQKQWIQIRSHSELEARQVNVGVADSYRSVELPVMIDMLRDKKRNNQSSDRHLEDKNKSHLMPSDSVSRPVSGDFKPGSRQRQSSRFLESSDLERLLAPDPYRKKSKDSNGSVEPGQPVTFESSSRPPMVKMKTVDINAPPIPTRHPTANGGSIKPVDNISSKPKNIRKRPVQRSKSDMDKYLDGKIEKAYSEEIVRRASVKSEGDADKRNGSISSLSELAEYEEQVSKQWERFRDKFRALSRKGLRDHSVPSENVDLKGQTPSDGPPTDTSVREPPHHITTDPPQPSELRKAERGTRESRTSKLPVPIDSWKSPAGSGFVRVITDDAKHSKNEFKRPDRSGDDKCKSTAPTRPQKRYSVRGQPVPLKTELVRQDKNISAGKDRHPPSGSETTEDGKDYHLGYADSQVRDQHHPKSVKGMPSGGTESPRPKSIGHPSSDGGKQIHGVRPSPRHGEEKARYYPDSGEDGVGKAKIAKSPEPIYSQSGSGNVPENKGETVPGAPGGKGKKAFDSDRPSPRSDQMAEEAAPLTPQRLIKRPADQNRRRESGGPERLVPPKLASEENKTERVKPGRLPFDGSQTHRRAEGCSPLTDRHPPKSVEYETSEQGKPTFRSARGSKNREQLPTKTVDDEKTRKPESGLPDKADDGRFRSAASTRSSHGDLAPSRAIASRSRYSPEGRARSKPEKPLSETGRHKIHEPTVAENVKSPHDPTATSTDVSGLKQGDTGSERKPFISRIGGYIRDHTHMFDKLPQRKHQKDREENEQFNDSAANDSVKVSSTSPPPFKPISDRRHPQKRRLYEEIDVNQDQKIKRPSSMEPGTRMTPRSTDGKMQSGPVGRPRHPPPPTSPNSPRHRVARRGDNVKENRPPSSEDYRLPGSKGEPPALSDGEPDEYNLLTQFNQKQFSPKKPVPPRESYGSLTKGPRRKRPQPDPGVRREDEMTTADETRRAKQRHPPPPKSSSNRYQDPQDDLADERRGSLVDSEPMAYDDDPEYINFPPYSFPAAVPNLRDEDLRIGRVQESSEQSSYDPRLGDIFIPKFPTPRSDKEKHSKKTKKEPQPRPSQEEPKPQLPRTGSRTSKRYQQNQPNVPPRGETAHVIPLNKPKDVNRDVINDFDEDDDDLEESEEDLKPPALRIIPQTRSDADAFVPSDRLPPGMSPGTVVTLRHPHKQYLLANRQPTSPHGSLISPTGPSLQSSQGGGSMVRRDDGQHHHHHSSRYRPEQFNPSHYDHASRELDGREHASRPRTKRTTATSRDSDHHRHHGSKHSLVISTKRRTLSGVTGANPIKFRSNSMNALWFGDHPIPSSGTLSPAIPVRLSTIQLQAQAELERRERSTSRGHSMDRRSGISLTGTESRISRPNGELEPYQGIGYGYDARGRMIHGGAPLHARAASRKRRLHDGHESLSRVWIPDTSPTRRTTTDRSPSPGTHLDKRQANLNNSAVAFALKDFTAPGVRANTFCPGREEPSEDRSEDMAESLTVDEHIYARPESLFSKTVNTRKSPLQPPPLPARRQSQQVHGTSKGTNGLKRSSTRSDLSTKSWQRPSGLSRPSHYRRPHLVPNRWGSVPLPKPDQYDSIVHLSTRTLDTDISKRNRYLNYQLESNV